MNPLSSPTPHTRSNNDPEPNASGNSFALRVIALVQMVFGVGPNPAEEEETVRYDFGMTTKIAVSLPDEAVAAARQAVADGSASSVSAFIAAAVADKTRFRDLEQLLADMAAESGPPDENDRIWARQALGLQ
jgi:Arc/MetJ-type ribon-helix-helix transcriptional regulator